MKDEYVVRITYVTYNKNDRGPTRIFESAPMSKEGAETRAANLRTELFDAEAVEK